MGKHGIDDLVYSKAREVVYEQMKWTATENTFLSRNEKGDLDFSDCLAGAVERSSLGAVLRVPEEDRESVPEASEPRDDFTEDADSLVAEAMQLTGALDAASVARLLTVLRLVDCGITRVDPALRDLERLKFLNLSGNGIAALPGDRLPRGLHFLELFKNEINDVRSLFASMPKALLHLGLGRNKLTDSSGLEALERRKGLSLRSLDLGDNDLINANSLLSALTNLPHLTCLSLEGNPCSMGCTFPRAVMAACPALRYLDGMRTEHATPPCASSIQTGSLLFHCFRLSGLPAEDPALHRYHVDVDIPLFDPVKRLRIMERIMGAEPEEGDVLRFATPSMPWNGNVEFPSLRIRVPYFAGLTELRDVFRSVVTVRVVHEVGETSEETLAEFGVSLESIPWWVPSLNYEWESGMKCATRATEGDYDGNGASGPALKCHVGFGVERISN